MTYKYQLKPHHRKAQYIGDGIYALAHEDTRELEVFMTDGQSKNRSIVFGPNECNNLVKAMSNLYREEYTSAGFKYYK